MTRRRQGITPAMYDEIVNAPCRYCDQRTFEVNEVDHVIPFSRGGSDDRENLVAACWRCNQEKRDMTPDEWRRWREHNGMPWPPPSWETILKFLSWMMPEDMEPLADLIAAKDPDATRWWNDVVDECRRTGELSRDTEDAGLIAIYIGEASIAALYEGGDRR